MKWKLGYIAGRIAGRIADEDVSSGRRISPDIRKRVVVKAGLFDMTDDACDGVIDLFLFQLDHADSRIRGELRVLVLVRHCETSGDACWKVSRCNGRLFAMG